MKLIAHIVLLFTLLFFACNNSKSNKSEILKSGEPVVTSTEYTTKTGKKFIVQIDRSMGVSIFNVQIETRNFEAVNTIHKIGVIDPVEEVFLADLDTNGFEEIYLFTQSAGSGSYGNIYGIASNKDKSATPIYLREISEKQMKMGGLFEGFKGHNVFSLLEGKLVNTFPVYLEGDYNAKPTGSEKKVYYQLRAGEAGWILEPVQTIQ